MNVTMVLLVSTVALLVSAAVGAPVTASDADVRDHIAKVIDLIEKLNNTDFKEAFVEDVKTVVHCEGEFLCRVHNVLMEHKTIHEPSKQWKELLRNLHGINRGRCATTPKNVTPKNEKTQKQTSAVLKDLKECLQKLNFHGGK